MILSAAQSSHFLQLYRYFSPITAWCHQAILYVQGDPEKIAQSLMYYHFAAVRRRITQFAPKCSTKITVCQSMQNFVVNKLNILWYTAGIGYMSSVTSPACDLTSDRWRLIVVPDFTEPPNWLPNSPDLNPVDCSIWDALQQLVYRQKIKDTDHPKQVLNSCWDMISQEIINAAVDQWSKRLLLVIRSQGGHTEHRFH